MIILTIPGLPPSVNHCYRRGWQGHLILTDDAKAYIDEIFYQSFGVTPLSGKLFLEVIAYKPNRKLRDLDNFMKILQDGLMKGGFITDDGDIRYLCVRDIDDEGNDLIDPKNPRLEIKLGKIEERMV